MPSRSTAPRSAPRRCRRRARRGLGTSSAACREPVPLSRGETGTWGGVRGGPIATRASSAVKRFCYACPSCLRGAFSQSDFGQHVFAEALHVGDDFVGGGAVEAEIDIADPEVADGAQIGDDRGVV